MPSENNIPRIKTDTGDIVTLLSLSYFVITKALRVTGKVK